METVHFWESRAQRFAGEGAGLRAVCSYAMPEFYNRAIDITQRAALRPLIASIPPGADVLDYGCGVGRWTREIAKRGAHVTAVDFSRTMLSEAVQRTAHAHLGERCRFLHADVFDLQFPARFDVIIGVTVLQHVLDDARLATIITRLASFLKPGGRLVLVEAAPSRDEPRCATPTFKVRTVEHYQRCLEAAGLTVEAVRGVDPMRLKQWVVPSFTRWPRPLALAALAAATLISLPIDILLRQVLVRYSWHKVIVAAKTGSNP